MASRKTAAVAKTTTIPTTTATTTSAKTGSGNKRKSLENI